MNAESRHDEPTLQDSPVVDRYAAIKTGDDELVVFDAQNDDAWIQSSAACCITTIR